jgi:hypothetical protein
MRDQGRDGDRDEPMALLSRRMLMRLARQRLLAIARDYLRVYEAARAYAGGRSASAIT